MSTMNIATKYITLVIFLIIMVEVSKGEVEFADAIYPELVTSGRAMAMGNAYISSVNDSASAFYNPAGLGSIRSTRLHLSNFHVETNKGWVRAATDGSLLDLFGNFFKGFSTEGTRELLLNRKGVVSYSRFHAMPNFVTRYLTAGYIFSKKSLAYIGKTANAPFEYASRLDHGPYAAFNLSMMGGVLKVGGTVIYLNRTETSGTAAQDVKFDLKDKEYMKGAMLQFTGGVKLTLPIMYLPTFSATIHNAFDKDYTATTGYAGAPEKTKRTIDAGVSLTPQIGKTTRIRVEANYKDLTTQYEDVANLRRITFGIEFSFNRLMFLRFGYGDGFGSAGVGLKTQRLEFDLSTYAVDQSTSDFRGEEDRRFSLTMSVGL